MRFFLPVVFLALAACGGTGDPDPAIPVDGAAGPVDSGGGTWPANAPVYAPAYPGARITNVIKSVSNGVAGSQLRFETDDAPAAVVTFYKRRAGTAGLPEVATLINDGTALFSAGAANGAGINVQATAGDGKTVAVLTFSNGSVNPGL